jgi:pimeloyl-ACP methyl ester carboxylesterase
VLPSVPIPFAGTIAAQESLEHFFVDCRADEGCNNAYPDLESQTRKLLATDGEAGFIFNTAITAALYDPRITANLPAAVDLAADNHFQPLLTLAAGSREGPSATTLSSGAYLAVLCSEDVPFVGEDELEQAAETVFTDRTLRGLVETCRPWPSVELPEGARDLPTSEVPVLLVSGELDPVTSAKHAQLAADQLPNSRLIVMKAAGHSGASNDCALNLLTQFVAAGAVDSLDVACAQAGQRPAFPLP